MKFEDAASQAPQQPNGTPTETNEIKGDQWTIHLPKTRIHTLEQLLKACDVDTQIWEVERFICNKWDVAMVPRATTTGKPKKKGGRNSWERPSTEPIVEQLYQVKAFLRRKIIVIAARKEIEELRQKAVGHTPRYPKAPGRASTGVLAEFALVDHHYGALIWGKETGGDDYDTSLAKQCWENALASLVVRVDGFQPEKALIVLGNDQQNADNRAGTTERGTAQNMDGRYQKVFAVSRDASIWAIDMLLAKYKAVHVVMVAGNHDPLSAWHLGDSLTSWYRKCERVTVDNRPLFRKYFEYGQTMILFTHGHAGKLEEYGQTMAFEQPEMWGRTRWREAHTGDKHHRRVIECGGATVRILPSLRPPDAWSSENHYVRNIRAAEAYVWSESEGLIGSGVYSVIRK